MNRNELLAVGVAAAVVLVGAVGAFGALGGSGPGGSGPGVPTDTPADTATPDEGTSLDYEGDAVTVTNATGQVVAGTTDLDPGTELTVRLRSVGSAQPFIKQATATVSEDGRFEAAFDFSGIEAGGEFTVAVRHEGENVTTARGEVVAGGPGPAATPTEPSEEESAATIQYDGDAVTLQNAADQTVAGTTDLGAGAEVTVRLRSSGGDQPFIKQATATVSEDGRFEATFDFSGIDADSEFTVTVRHDGEAVAEAPGEVVAAE